MFNKRGAIEELPPALPSLLLLALILVTFGMYFFACGVTSVFGFCGGKPADVIIDSSETVLSSRLITLLQTPVLVNEKKEVFADLVVDIVEFLPKGADYATVVQSPLGKAYVRETDLLLNAMVPEDLKGKIVWKLKVVNLLDKKEIAPLTRAPEGGGIVSNEVVSQAAVLPLKTKDGAVRVELVLLCRDCSKEVLERVQ